MGSSAPLILTARAMRALADGCVSVILPAYLLALDYSPVRVGVLITATMLGSAALTLAVGFFGARLGLRASLLAASALMALTGLGFGTLGAFWPLIFVAFVGTLNPSAGDISVFLPLEHAALAGAVSDDKRTSLFAAYALTGALAAAAGTLLATLPERFGPALNLDVLSGFRFAFLFYAVLGVAAGGLYLRLPRAPSGRASKSRSALGPSRKFVVRIATLFCVDSFAGGLVAQSILALWLFARFDLSVTAVAQIFFATQLLTALSYVIAVRLAARFGLVNTMVFSHIPANLCLIALPFAGTLWIAVALLMIRGLLSQMDVPTRNSYVMAMVTPPERPAAASFTAVPRNLAGALGPTLGGFLLTLGGPGWPFLAGGLLKIGYDLALLALFRRHKPPEERTRETPQRL